MNMHDGSCHQIRYLIIRFLRQRKTEIKGIVDRCPGAVGIENNGGRPFLMPVGSFDPSGHGCFVFRFDPLCLASHGDNPFICNGTHHGFHLLLTGAEMTAPSNAEY